jgi:hypothetical protein
MSGNDAAFPGEKNIRFGQPNDCNEGLTKRDLFAAMAMQGFIANKANPLHFHTTDDAQWCVTMADALLAELEKQP